jgi:hypothetical protein
MLLHSCTIIYNIAKEKEKIEKLVILGYTRFFFVSKIILDGDFTKKHFREGFW